MSSPEQLRATLNDARARPEAGGALFSAWVGAQCGRADQQADMMALRQRAGTTTPASSAQALQDLQRLCSSLTPEERHFGTQLRIVAGANYPEVANLATRDPYLSALLALRMADGSRESAVKKALAHFDPAQFSPLLKPQNGKIWFNGSSFELGGQSRDGEALIYATSLAACAFGVPCDSSDMEIKLSCALDDQYCGAQSRRDLVKRTIADAGLPAAVYDKANDLAVQIVDAIKTGRSEAFLPR